MRSVIYSMGVSLDGYNAGPGGDIAPPPPDAEVWRSVADEIRAVGVHLMGRRLADSLFERVEDLGLRRMHLEPTPAAVAAGLADAFSSASAGVGRGERGCPATNDLLITMRLAEPPEPCEWLRSA